MDGSVEKSVGAVGIGATVVSIAMMMRAQLHSDSLRVLYWQRVRILVQTATIASLAFTTFINRYQTIKHVIWQ